MIKGNFLFYSFWNVQKCETVPVAVTDTTTITSTTAATVSSTISSTTAEKQTLIDEKHEIKARNEYVKKIAYDNAAWFSLKGFTCYDTKNHLGEFDTFRPSL